MKTLQTLLTSALFLILIFPGQTDEAEAQRLGIGVTGGIHASSHLHNFRFAIEDINLDLSPTITAGYSAGLVVRQGLTQHLRIQAEPGITMLGADYNDTFTLRGFDFETESSTDLLYVQLPLLLQLTTAPPERTIYGRDWATTTYHLSGGVFGGYLLDATFSGVNTGAPIGIEFQGAFSNDVTDQYKPYDAGVLIGGGLEHGNTTKIGMEARVMFSVLDSGDAPHISFRNHNMAASLAVYFLF